jgi:glycosyltransferase involved in cell wall biosynthesis
MKILLIQPIGHRTSGLTADIVLFSNTLTGLGADVTLLTFNGILINPAEKVKQVTFCERHYMTGSLLRRLEKILGHWPILDFTFWMDTFLTFSLVPKLIKNEQYDVIHILESHPLIVPLIILALSIKKHALLLTVRTSMRESQSQLNQKIKEALKNRNFRIFRRLAIQKIRYSNLINVIIRFFFRKAQKRNQIVFTCESPYTEKAYKDALFNAEFVCIPIGAFSSVEIMPRSIAREQLKLPVDGTILLSFGVNHMEKNYEIVFQAISQLPKNFTFLYAGKIDHNNPENDPEKLANKYSCVDRTIIFDKFIPQETTKYYFFAANAILLSYTKEFLHASGVLTFATTYNLPVIASEVGQLGEIVKARRLGLTFAPDDPNSLKQAITEFLKLPESEYNQFRENLKAFAASYSWGDIAQKHLELYKKLSDTNQLKATNRYQQKEEEKVKSKRS